MSLDPEHKQCCKASQFDVLLYCAICGAHLCASHSERRHSDGYVCRGDHRQPPFTFTCGRCGREFHELPRGADGTYPEFPPPPFGVYERVRPVMQPPDPSRPFYCHECASEKPCTWWRRP